MTETLGHYRILDRIGSGGLGDVYRARDTRAGRTVAIKVVPAGIADDPVRRKRLHEDARAAAALSHPNLAALYEIGEHEGQLFLVFEFVPGQTLKAIIAGRPLNPRRAVDVAIQIADALADGHAEGIVHRDLTSENIILTPKGNAKILDFGLASWTGGGARREPDAILDDAPGARALATASYLSPEQALGEPFDQRTDIFSLGIIMFEMLTGRLPFSGSSPSALALQIAQARPQAPTALNPALPGEINAIVSRALSKSLDQRYEAAATLAAELRSVAAILDVRAAASEPVSPPVVARRRGSSRWVVIVTLLALFGAAAWWQRGTVIRAWQRAFGPAAVSRVQSHVPGVNPPPQESSAARGWRSMLPPDTSTAT